MRVTAGSTPKLLADAYTYVADSEEVQPSGIGSLGGVEVPFLVVEDLSPRVLRMKIELALQMHTSTSHIRSVPPE